MGSWVTLEGQENQAVEGLGPEVAVESGGGATGCRTWGPGPQFGEGGVDVFFESFGAGADGMANVDRDGGEREITVAASGTRGEKEDGVDNARGSVRVLV